MTFSCIKKMPLPSDMRRCLPTFRALSALFFTKLDAPGHWHTLETSVPRQPHLVPKSSIGQPVNAHGQAPHLSKPQDVLSGDPLPASLLRRDTNPAVDSQMAQPVSLERTSADGGSCSIENASFVGFVALVIEKPCSEIGGSYPRTLG